MRDKKRGPGSRKPTGPERMTEAKRILKSRQKELESQEAKILLKFLETYPPGDVSLAAIELLWDFLKWLRTGKISLVSPGDIFYIPFSHLAAAKNLK